MFSDVRGFTRISELYKSDPQGLTSLMNSFLTPLTNAIIEHNGTIDKYMGDAIMAFWNAPLNDAQHEVNACEAALEMLRARRDAQPAARAAGAGNRPALHSAQCRRRYQHRPVRGRKHGLRSTLQLFGARAIRVNLASRLEGQSKNYGVPIIVGSKTATSRATSSRSLSSTALP